MEKNINYNETFLNIFKNKERAKEWIERNIKNLEIYNFNGKYCGDLYNHLFNEVYFIKYNTAEIWLNENTTGELNCIIYCQNKHNDKIADGKSFTDLTTLNYRKLANLVNYYLGYYLLNESTTYNNTEDNKMTKTFINKVIIDLKEFYKSIN